jgi:hypothetical protein
MTYHQCTCQDNKCYVITSLIARTRKSGLTEMPRHGRTAGMSLQQAGKVHKQGVNALDAGAVGAATLPKEHEGSWTAWNSHPATD